MFGFEGTNLQFDTAQWLSWLERRPVTAEVEGSSPFWVVCIFRYKFYTKWGLSSAGRASALQAEGHRFEPYRPHSFRKMRRRGSMAEQLICNQQVIGSSPIVGSMVFYKAIWMDSRVAKGDRL